LTADHPIPGSTPSAVDEVDPITLTVVWSGLRDVCDDIGYALRRTAHSEIVRDAGDCAAAVFDARGRNVAQGVFSPGMLGPMTFIVGHMLERFPAEELSPGDSLITNDIYIGAGHLPDAFTVTPVFVEDDLIGFVGSSVHLMDVGGAVVGSLSVDGIIDNYQEGLRIPPIRHYENGEPVENVTRMIANNVRFPEKVLGDIRAMIAANNFGARRLSEFFARYGPRVLNRCFDRLLDDSEARTRAAIAALPDGVYSREEMLDDYGPGTPPVKLAVDLRIGGSDVEIDWSRADPQVPAGMNSAHGYSLAYSAFTFKALVSPDVPMNEGCMRPIAFTAPEGSFLNPRPPAPGGGRAVTVHRHFETIAGAMADALPDGSLGACSQFCNTMAAGTDEDGRPYMLWDMLMGGFPARSTKDGAEGLCSVLNGRNIPVEVSETWAPVLVERLEFVRDTGGPGEHRGACAVRKDIRFLGSENRVTPITDRHHFPPHGVHGGGAGACGQIVVNPAAEATPAHSKAEVEVAKGDVVSFQVSGAGGYGPALRRSPARVAEDVLEGYVSRAAALCEYGVAVDHEGGVDDVATRRHRANRETKGDERK
jgi:N-methylhydantoinase B